MFRVNRIGTPQLHETSGIPSTVNFTPSAELYSATIAKVNVINASPLLDFGYTNLKWAGAAEAISSNVALCLGQQFTITQPLAGNVRGLELVAAIEGAFPASLHIQPFLTKLAAAGASILELKDEDSPMTFIAPSKILSHSDDGLHVWGHNYTVNAVVRNSTSIAGTYAHGFRLVDNSGAGWSLNFFRMNAFIRQLNDQQSVAYSDTLR